MSATFLPSDDVIARMRGRSGLRAYLRLAGQIQLVPPALCASAMALCGALVGDAVDSNLPRVLALSALAALLVQAATTALQQLGDVDIDRINDPGLPICSGEVSAMRAGVFAWGAGSLALLTVLVLCVVTRHWVALPLFAAFALTRGLRSIRGIHLKTRAWPASSVIALVEGTMLAAAGWALTGSLVTPQAWILAAVAGLLVLCASLLRELSSMRGDAAYGVATLATAKGPSQVAMVAAPLLFAPYLLLPLGAATDLVRLPQGQWVDALFVALGCGLMGLHLAALLVGDPDAAQQPGSALRSRFAALCGLYFAGMAVAHVPYSQWGLWIRGLA